MSQTRESPDLEDGSGLLQFASDTPAKQFCRRTTGEVRKATNPPKVNAKSCRP